MTELVHFQIKGLLFSPLFHYFSLLFSGICRIWNRILFIVVCFFYFFKHILINENEGYTGEETCDTLIWLITCPFINTLSCDLCYIMHVFFQRLTVLIWINQVFFAISKAWMYYSSQSVFKWYVITDPMELWLAGIMSRRRYKLTFWASVHIEFIKS